MRKIFERYLTLEKTLRYNLPWNGRYPRCVPELNKNRLKVDIVSTIQKSGPIFKARFLSGSNLNVTAFDLVF